jgi:hypothetical protein
VSGGSGGGGGGGAGGGGAGGGRSGGGWSVRFFLYVDINVVFVEPTKTQTVKSYKH